MTLAVADMAAGAGDRTGNGGSTASRTHRRSGLTTAGLALLTALASFAVLMGITPVQPEGLAVPAVMVVNGMFVAILGWLIGRELFSLFVALRSGRAASQLHVRLVTLFSVVAAVPAILVAALALVTLDLGLDRWFDVRTRAIVGSSIEVAEAYVEENARNLQGQTVSMAAALESAGTLYRLDRTGFQRLLDNQARGRGLLAASLLRESGATEVAATTNTANPRPVPPLGALADAKNGQPILISPGETALVGAILKLESLDLYLYTLRTVDDRVIDAQQLMRENADEFDALETGQTQFKIAFALLYLGVTLIVLLAAIWAGLGIADRLVTPIGRLIAAAGEVSGGNLNATVDPEGADADLRALSDTFNDMTVRLRSQRDELIDARDQIDARRRFSEAVLSGVTAGVLGVSADGRISIANRSAEQLLGDKGGLVGRRLSTALPEIEEAFASARMAATKSARVHLTVRRAGRERTLDARIAGEAGGEAYVLTLDDITDLVTAQRSTAWADVARRIAHEIKNPLTPIQLSAERLNRRYGRKLTEDREVFDQCTGTIVRHVEDIKRMVDEFSSFARMPKPTKEKVDLRTVAEEAAFLITMSRTDIRFDISVGDEPIEGEFDARMLGRAIGNVVKNATEAIDAVPERRGRVALIARRSGDHAVLDVIDNGKGLPAEDRHKLLEPYMTTREKGTGLGLPIVRKIIEDHGGILELHDAPPAFEGGVGAMMRMWLPLNAPQDTEIEVRTEVDRLSPAMKGDEGDVPFPETPKPRPAAGRADDATTPSAEARPAANAEHAYQPEKELTDGV